MIPITKPFLPPLREYNRFLTKIWEINHLTNNGPLLNKLEYKLKKYLDLKNLLLVSNGTISLQLAIKALNLKGEIITTPFSYIATTTSIIWEGCKPIFVDIDSDSLNIDVNKIENAINSKTVGILATHVFGNPCNIERINKISKKYNLKIIYDAAHCFGTEYKNKSILNYGDISTISFHATKLFHTIEGGAIISNNDKLDKKMKLMRNFGHTSEYTFECVGINAKLSEVHAAIGIINLNYMKKILSKRKFDHDIYDYYLQDNIKIKKPIVTKYGESNYSYYPIILKSESECINLYETFKKHNISSRRYFYPCLSTLEFVKSKKMKTSNSISKKILCLPLYYDLKKSDIKKICKLILNTLK